MVRAVGFYEEVDGPFVVVVGAPGPAEHLLELLYGEPLDTHRQRVEDDLRGGEVNPCRQRGGRNDSRQILIAEHPFDLLSATVVQSGVVRRGVVLQLSGDLVTPASGVGEDDGLTAVAFEDFVVELPLDEFLYRSRFSRGRRRT